MAKEKTLPTQEELVEVFRSEQEDEQRPLMVKELGFGRTSDGDMTLRTETPPRMIQTLVRMRILEAARDPNRTESLVSIFIHEYDRRMVSLNRKGRLELLGAMQALAESEKERQDITLR